MGDRVFATPWRLVPMAANGQPAFACYQGVDGAFRLSALNVLHVRGGRIAWIAAFSTYGCCATSACPTISTNPSRTDEFGGAVVSLNG